ncbi:PAS domain S-box-containing protein [Desulfopila aestuarii DSM 18488]|uniref:histidine kinase n=2 Tax=Desulfopila aestuarii TaxID=231440 RepID=A0A1M7YG69_9BACT|nr:PAS domain S-box-containing protein [Desulfopila aestuarii DSM 18488]
MNLEIIDVDECQSGRLSSRSNGENSNRAVIEQKNIWFSLFWLGILTFILLAVYWTDRSNYLLFHSFAELVSISVAWSVGLVVWNTRQFLSDDSLPLLGIAYLFIGVVDLLHTLAYKGMGVFPEAGADLPTQLWIAGRYLESLSLLMFAIFIGRSLRMNVILSVYVVITSLMLSSIFYIGVFPHCFVEGTGLTPFKKISEYFISLILVVSAGFLWRKRSALNRVVLWLMMFSIGLTVIAELAFTFYISVFGLSNLIGHYFKIISTCLVYLALIQKGLRQPYATLFRNLAHSEQKFRVAYDHSPLMMGIISQDKGTWIDVNMAFAEATGYARQEVIGSTTEGIPLFSKEDIQHIQHLCLNGDKGENIEIQLHTNNGHQRTILLNGEKIEIDTVPHLLIMMQDITEQKKTETERKISLDLLKIINEQADVHQLVRDVCRKLAEWADMEAVGIRLKDGEDYPYYEWCGFPNAFIEAEKSLCSVDSRGDTIRDEAGNPVLECMCGNILLGRYNPELPFFTDNGSFFTNSTSALLASTSEKDRQARTRNRCHGEGYESVALIPLRFGNEVIGLLQLNDNRKERFSKASIKFFEQLAGNLAIALKERKDVEIIGQERSLMKLILSAASQIFILKDTEGRYQMVNQAFCQYIGKSEDQIIGQKNDELYPPETAKRFNREDEETIANGKTLTFDRRHGDDWFLVTKTPVYGGDEGIVGILVSMKNISDRKRTEKLLSSRLLLSEFANNNSLEALLQKTLDEAEILTDSKIGFFHHISEQESLISLQQWSSQTKTGICSVNLTDLHYPVEQAGIWADSIRLRKPLIYNDYENISNTRGLPKGHVPVTRILTVPVFSGDTIVAMLGVGNKQLDYSECDIEQVSTLANMAWDIVTRKRAEESLQKSAREVERMMDNLPGMVYRCANNEEWIWEFVSNGSLSLTGYEPEELTGNNGGFYADLIEPEYRQDIWNKVQSAAAANAPYEIEYPIRHRDGTVRWLWERGQMVNRDGKQPSCFEGFIADITDKRKIREQITMQARVLAQISDSVTITELNGNIIDVNVAQARAMKRSREWFIGKNISVFDLPLKTSPSQEEILQNTIGKGSWHGEVVNIASDGSLLYLDLRTNVIQDDNGKVIALCGVATDLTKARKREAELRRLVLAIDQAAEIIMITDDKGRIEYVNPSFSLASGYSKEEIIGENPRIFKSGKHDDQFYNEMWEDLNAGRIWQGRITNKKKDGSLYIQEGTISPVKDEKERIVNFVAVMRDITEMLDMEDRFLQAQRLEAIGTLAGGIAHDFNNILFPIIGAAEILHEDLPQGSSLHSYVTGIMDSALRAADLVKQILTFSRQGELKLKPVKVQIIVKEVVKLMRATLPSTINIRETVHKECPLIMADATQIHQVVMNLVTNAFHAMEKNGGRLTILLDSLQVNEDLADRLEVKAGRYVCLTVTDTGEGIDEKALPRIFDPYFTTKAEGKGTGLGLSVSHGIVRKFGGAIDVESKKGGGSTFRVYFPISNYGEQALLQFPDEKLQGGSERILLVDDEVSIVKLVNSMLTRLGYRVTSRTSSIEALELYLANPQQYDLVLTDLTMPNMTGERLAAEIKRVRPSLPVVVFTGFSEKMDDEKSQLMGVNGYLLKPVLKKDLAQILRQILDSPTG